MRHDTTLSRTTLERMIGEIEPAWQIADATPAEAGHHAVYHLAVETPDGRRECYLKGTPAGKAPSIGLEARLLAVLRERTEIPVPAVYGVVDEHETLPTPFLLLEAVDGEIEARTDLATLPPETHRVIARETGRYLADLHALDAVDAYGFLTAEGPRLHGGRPSGDPATVAVADPTTDWQECLHGWADGTLDRLADTRFADVGPDAEPVLRSRIDDLAGSFDPVLARVDQSLENVLLADGDLRALIDWEFTIAATPAYDVVCVGWSLAGGQYLFAPDVPDRRDLVQEAVLAGYEEGGSTRVLDQVRANRECYELLATLRSMVHLEDWYRLFDLGEAIDEAAGDLRNEVAARL